VTARRKRAAATPPELVAEVIASPGVRVHGPPTALGVLEAPPPAAPPPAAQTALGVLAQVPVPAELAARIRQWLPLGLEVLGAVRAIRDALEDVAIETPPPPRVRRARRR
jgi:hypothetical protein